MPSEKEILEKIVKIKQVIEDAEKDIADFEVLNPIIGLWKKKLECLERLKIQATPVANGFIKCGHPDCNNYGLEGESIKKVEYEWHTIGSENSHRDFFFCCSPDCALAMYRCDIGRGPNESMQWIACQWEKNGEILDFNADTKHYFIKNGWTLQFIGQQNGNQTNPKRE